MNFNKHMMCPICHVETQFIATFSRVIYVELKVENGEIVPDRETEYTFKGNEPTKFDTCRCDNCNNDISVSDILILDDTQKGNNPTKKKRK